MQIPERKNRLKVMSECLRVLKSNRVISFLPHMTEAFRSGKSFGWKKKKMAFRKAGPEVIGIW